MLFDWTPLYLSFKLALVTTLILSVISFFLVFALHKLNSPLRPFANALVSLPLVLPPSVLGYYLLIAFRPDSWIGQLTDEILGLQLVFSFTGLVVGSVIFSLPFMVNPILSALENLPQSYQEAAATLGKSNWVTYRKVLLPNIKPSILVGIVMTFAHTIGEFGVILMIGGNIPDETRVASIAIYNEVEMMNYESADFYSIILLSFSLGVLVLVNFFKNTSS